MLAVSFHPDASKIRRMHTLYFGGDPTELQGSLYDLYPKAHGYSYGGEDAERFRAVLHLGLIHTIPENGDIGAVRPTYLLYPQHQEAWVLGQVKANAEVIFGRLREQRRVEAAKFLGACFQALRLGHLLVQIPGAPDRWVAHGFVARPVLPDWLRTGLVQV